MKIQKKIILLLPILFFSCAKKQPNLNAATSYLKEAAIEADAGNYQKALYFAEQAYKINPVAQVAALKATLLYQLKKFNESLDLFKKIIADPKTPSNIKADVMNNYACNLLCLDKKEEAKLVWQQLVSDKNYLSPEAAWFNLGMIEVGEGLRKRNSSEEKVKLQANINFGTAIKYFENATDIACNYIDAYFYLAYCQVQLQKFDDAKKNLIIVLSKAPEHKPAADFLKQVDKKILDQQGTTQY